MKPHIYFIEKSSLTGLPTVAGESIVHDGITITDDIETFIPEYKDYGSGLEKVWSIDKSKGTLTFTGSNQVKTLTLRPKEVPLGSDGSDDIVEVYIEIDIPPYNALDMTNYENIAYIKENYDIENFENEKLYSREIATLLTNDDHRRWYLAANHRIQRGLA